MTDKGCILDHGGETAPVNLRCGTTNVELEMQRTIKRSELGALLMSPPRVVDINDHFSRCAAIVSTSLCAFSCFCVLHSVAHFVDHSKPILEFRFEKTCF